jgi:hypothetical protein
MLLFVFCGQHIFSFSFAFQHDNNKEKLLLAEDAGEEEDTDDSEEKDLEDELDKILCPFDQGWTSYDLYGQRLPISGSLGYYDLSIPIQLPPPEDLV